MAVFSTSYFDRYALDFEELASIPDDVLDSMIEAEAEIIKEGQAQSAATMLQGPYYKGGIVRSLKIGKVKRSRDGREVSMSSASRDNRRDRLFVKRTRRTPTRR